MLLLLVSLSMLGLFAGALLPALGRARAQAGGLLSGVALGMLPALVLVRLLPHTFESLGAWSLAFAALGFGLVTLSHHAGERAEARLGSALVLPALLLHAVTDGAALAMSSTGRVGGAGGLLAAAAILHRVPEGLFVATRKRSTDTRSGLAAALPLAIATLVGALLGQRLFELLPDSVFDAVLALGAGAMLRLLSHTHDEQTEPQTTSHALCALGFLAGLWVVLAVPGPHDVLQSAEERELSIAVSLLPLFIESAPALLAGLSLAAALRAWPGAHGAPRGVLSGFARGLRQPRGDAEALALAGQWLERRVPARAALAFMVSGLSLGAESAALSLRLLGLPLGLTRLAGGALLALGLAYAARAQPDAPASSAAEPARERWLAALRALLDQHGAALCCGLLAAAALEAALPPTLLARLGSPWDLPLAAAAGALCQLSALAATPLAAVLLHKGASVGAALTFAWLAPLLRTALLAWLRRHLGLRAALGFGAGAVLVGLGLGFAANQGLSTRAVPEVHRLVAHSHAAWELACALALGCLLLDSLLRLGPRGFAAGLRAAPLRAAEHDHAHAHAHAVPLSPHPAHHRH